MVKNDTCCDLFQFIIKIVLGAPVILMLTPVSKMGLFVEWQV